MSEEQKCETGCQHFTGGEIKHDKNCVFYPESLSEMYDQQQANHKEELKKANDRIQKLERVIEIYES